MTSAKWYETSPWERGSWNQKLETKDTVILLLNVVWDMKVRNLDWSCELYDLVNHTLSRFACRWSLLNAGSSVTVDSAITCFGCDVFTVICPPFNLLLPSSLGFFPAYYLAFDQKSSWSKSWNQRQVFLWVATLLDTVWERCALRIISYLLLI